MMTIYVIDLESIPTRYTCEWKTHLPEQLKQHGNDVVVISGPDDLPTNTTPGMFLNFAATNIYKAVQVEKFSRLFSDGKIKDGDYFLFTDAWHPGILNLKYMSSLLGINIKIGGLWHSGSYDPADGLGRIIGDSPWIRHTENALYEAIDHNYFATKFHIDLFMETYGYQYDSDSCDDLEECTRNWTDGEISCGKIVQTGWPMDYMKTTLAPYKNLSKRDLILFPHRIAPEKQVDIFRDLALSLPQYEFVVCQDTTLSKREYHTLLGESKVVFSASIQETLGIVNCSEGPLLNSIPFCPDRLSYAEIFSDFSEFLYPSEWTEDWDSYLLHKDAIMARLCYVMEHYDEIQPRIETYIENTYKNYFESDVLIANLLRL